VTSAAIYARVSSARQKKDQTIGSQTAALREQPRQLGTDLPEEWVFENEGHSGATLARPALEALRDLAAWIWFCATPRTGSPASSPTRRCRSRSSPVRAGREHSSSPASHPR
jgi:Resolvase, N terminal domain